MTGQPKPVRIRRLGVFMLSGIILLEFGLRFISVSILDKPFWDDRRFVPDAHRIWKLNSGYEGSWGDFPYIKVNRFGLVGPEIDIPKPKRTVRLVVCGSSVTFGLGCQSIDSTAVSILAELLRNRNRDTRYEVLNASVPAYSSYNGLKFLHHDLGELDADVMIIAFGWADGLRDIAADKTVDKNWRIYDLSTRGALSYSYALQWIKSLSQKLRKDVPNFPLAKRARLPYRVSPDDFRNNIVSMITGCRRMGVVPVILGEPHPHSLVDSSRKHLLHERYLNILRVIATDMGVPMADADSAMAVYPPGEFFNYQQNTFCYPNSKGQLLMAQILAETLEKSGCLE